MQQIILFYSITRKGRKRRHTYVAPPNTCFKETIIKRYETPKLSFMKRVKKEIKVLFELAALLFALFILALSYVLFLKKKKK